MNLLPRLTITAFLLLVPTAAIRADEITGEQLYKQHCVRCHGATGEGTKKAPAPLLGDKSVPQLATVIDHTMPEDDPDKLDATESKKVALYIADAFYSPAAQARIKPPRIELSRLTVKQYRNSIADIVASYRGSPKLDDRQGLRGQYFNSRGFDGNKRLIDRIDPDVQFDFRRHPPEADQELKQRFDPHQFSIRWEGSVLAPETGLYEFVVHTDHALRLWVNDNRTALIDAWVKSGSGTEFRGSVYLLAGRAYPIKLEFSKAKQGVDDSKKMSILPPKPASIALLWKRPHRVDEVIPARHLSPVNMPEVCVVEAPFPPDDRSLGWERGTAVTREWEAATTDGAIEAANYVISRLPELAGAADGAKDRDSKLKEFCRKFTERAFRRSLSDDEKRFYIDRQFEGAEPNMAVKRVVLLTLKSPRFLYPDSPGLSAEQAIAARLAIALWDSLPDTELLAAANAGKLSNPEELTRQATRMLANPRAQAKLREFLLTWLKVDQNPDLSKDAEKFPGFDPALAADLRTSLELFLDEMVSGPNADLRQLLLADDLYVNTRLANFYGITLPADTPVHTAKVFGLAIPLEVGFTKVAFEPERRAGVLTHPYILSALAYNAESSPIHRGVFTARGLLGVTIRPPQEAFTPLPAELHPNLTTRDRVTLQTKPMACAGCHTVMNPLGFALENFDAVGRYREKENSKPIDASGRYETRAGEVAQFASGRELAKFLATSPEVHAAFTERLFQHYAKQPVMAYGIDRPERLLKSFSENGYNIRRLVVDAAVIAALKPPN